jgi:hypothetical protein
MLEDMKSKKERVINNVAENEDDANISSEII